MLAVVITVDCLAKQRDLGGSARGESSDFADHVGEFAAALRAPRHRNNAERALIIAAALHRHECRDCIVAHGGHVFVVLPFLERDFGGPLTVARASDQLRQATVAIRPDDEVHLRNALEQLGTEPLGHAADDAEHVAWPLVALQLAHAAEYALLGVVPDGAGVHEQHIGQGGIVRAHVSLASQDAEHQLGIRDVHLAAVGLDVDARHRQSIVTSKRGRPSHVVASR